MMNKKDRKIKTDQRVYKHGLITFIAIAVALVVIFTLGHLAAA